MNNKLRFWIIISFGAVLAAGIAGGLLLGRAWHRGDRPARTERREPPSLDRLAAELDLTAAQKEEIRKIFERNEDRLKELHSQVHLRLKEVREQLKADIDLVLTPPQREKFDALLERIMQKERDARRRHQGDRPSPPPDKPEGDKS